MQAIFNDFYRIYKGMFTRLEDFPIAKNNPTNQLFVALSKFDPQKLEIPRNWSSFAENEFNFPYKIHGTTGFDV